jgi:hypothetical protein
MELLLFFALVSLLLIGLGFVLGKWHGYCRGVGEGKDGSGSSSSHVTGSAFPHAMLDSSSSSSEQYSSKDLSYYKLAGRDKDIRLHVSKTCHHLRGKAPDRFFVCKSCLKHESTKDE